jgi:hypothetical protein
MNLKDMGCQCGKFAHRGATVLLLYPKDEGIQKLVSLNQTTGHTPEYCSHEGELLYVVVTSMYLLCVFSSFITIRQFIHSRGCKAFVCNVGV